MLIWLKTLLSNWKALSIVGVIGLALILGGMVWYYKAKAELKTEENKTLTLENGQLKGVVVNNQNQFHDALKAMEEERNRAVSRETLIRKKQQQINGDVHANDNLGPDYSDFFDQLWIAEQTANDNRTIHKAP